MAVGFGLHGRFELGPALALSVAYALATRVRFEAGAGWGDASQLILVPMLFVIPAPVVPAFVALGLFMATLVGVVRGTVHPDRLLRASQNLYAAGPALVFAVAGVHGAVWSKAPFVVAAFAAQVVLDLAPSTLREWIALGVPPRIQLSVVARVYMVDALLTPIGFIAALAAGDQPYRVLLILPLVG